MENRGGCTFAGRVRCLKFVLLFSPVIPNAKLHLHHHPLRNHGPELNPPLLIHLHSMQSLLPTSTQQPISIPTWNIL